MGVQNDNNVLGSIFGAVMDGYNGDTQTHRPTSEWERMSAMARGEYFNDKPSNRPSKDEYYLDTALALLQRSTCLRYFIPAGNTKRQRRIAGCARRGILPPRSITSSRWEAISYRLR